MAFVKRDYKDSLFCHLFGDERRKGNALQLYNALAGTSYADPEDIELTTIGDAVFLGRKNDVSFLVGDDMVLWEHQSTHNPNMPLRGLHYFSRLYTKLVTLRELDLYGTRRLQLPTPRYVVFYFGAEDRPDVETMRGLPDRAQGGGRGHVVHHPRRRARHARALESRRTRGARIRPCRRLCRRPCRGPRRGPRRGTSRGP